MSEIRDSTNTVLSGMILDGRFQICQALGRGGMGSVFLADDLKLSRQVAIKVLHPRFAAHAGGVNRFVREARILSTLRHEKILSVYSIGASDGLVYLVFEFLQGPSLGQHLHERGRMSATSAVPILIQICEALTYAHKNGILHRDLKPDNVVVLAQNDQLLVKVVDFGLATIFEGETLEKLTKTGEVVGDVRYMSPEQCRGEELDERSDIYSFGCLMYHLLSGFPPWDLDDPVALMHKHISDVPESFASNLLVPNALEAITFTSLAKDKRKRYQSFDEILELLQYASSDPNFQVISPAKYIRAKPAFPKIPVLLSVAALAFGALLGMVYFSYDNVMNMWYEQQINHADGKVAGTLMFQLAQRLDRQGKLAEACKMYRKSVLNGANDDISLTAHVRLAQIFLENSQYAESESEFSSAIDVAARKIRKSPNAMDEESMLEVLRQMHGLNSAAESTLACRLAGAFEDAHSFRQAEVIWRGALDLARTPNQRAQYACRLGLILAEQNRVSEALPWLDQAVKLAGDAKSESQIRRTIVAVLERQGRTDLASRYLPQRQAN